MAPLVEKVLAHFGIQGAILMTALASLACCISGSLMRPLPTADSSNEEVGEQQPLIDSGRASSCSSLCTYY